MTPGNKAMVGTSWMLTGLIVPRSVATGFTRTGVSSSDPAIGRRGSLAEHGGDEGTVSCAITVIPQRWSRRNIPVFGSHQIANKPLRSAQIAPDGPQT